MNLNEATFIFDMRREQYLLNVVALTYSLSGKDRGGKRGQEKRQHMNIHCHTLVCRQLVIIDIVVSQICKHILKENPCSLALRDG